MAKPTGGLTKWFKEDWRDVKTGKKCGRSGKEKKSRPYPACRPKAVAGRISKAEARKKTGRKTANAEASHVYSFPGSTTGAAIPCKED